MAKICPKCGREFENSRARCPICKIDLVSDGIDNSEAARKERLERLRQQQSRTHTVIPKQEQYRAPIQNKETIRQSGKKKAVKEMPMTTWKLVSGIISIIMCLIVFLQSCAVGVANTITNNGQVSGSAGAIVAVILMTGGIVSIVCRRGSKGGNIAISILYGIGAFIGAMLAGNYADLNVWSFWCLICSILAVLSYSRKSKKGIITIAVLCTLWIIIVLISDATSGNSGSKRNNTSGNSKTTFGVMETANSNNVKVTMTKYEQSNGSDWNSPSAGNVYVLAEFEIENNSNSDLAISSVLSFNTYVDNYATNLSLGALMDKSNEPTLDGTITPGMKMKGWIGWEVPSDWKKIEVHFTEDVWSGNTFKFLINK